MIKSFTRYLENIENSSMSLFTAFILFLIITSIRISTEFYLWVSANIFQKNPVFFEEYMHQLAFYLTMFLGGILIISYFSKSHALNVIKIVLKGWWILILPPIIDFIVLGRTASYRYGLPEDFMKNIFTLGLDSPYVGTGQIVMFFIIFSFTAYYILHKSKSFARMIVGVISIYFMIWIIGSPELYLPSSIENALGLYLWYLFLSTIFAFMLLYNESNHRINFRLIKHLKPMRTLHFVLMTITGFLVAGKVNFLNLEDYPYIISSISVIIFAWQYSSLINDVYDKDIDRISNLQRPLITGLITESSSIHIALIFAILAIGTGALLGIITLILTLAFIAFGTAYSVPPLRIRNYLFSSIVIGAGSAIAFLIGYFSPNFGGDIVDFTPKSSLIATLIFTVMSIAPITTDLKDFNGDKRMDVKTIYTVYGREKGKKIATILLFLVFFIPLLIYNSLIDFFLFFVLSATASLIFWKKESFHGIIVGYIILLLYCVLRVNYNIINF